MLIPFKSSPLVLVVMSSMFVPICNCCHVRRANSSKNHFLRWYPFLMPACAGLLEPIRSGLKLLKSTFNAENLMCISFEFISSHSGAIGN